MSGGALNTQNDLTVQAGATLTLSGGTTTFGNSDNDDLIVSGAVIVNGGVPPTPVSTTRPSP